MKTLTDIINGMEEFANPKLAQFDHIGLLQGEVEAPVRKIGITLDYSHNAIGQAIAANCDLLITHHGPMDVSRRLEGNALRKFTLASKNKLAVYRCHLSLDFCDQGIIEELCGLLEIPATKTLVNYNGHKLAGAVRLAESYPMSIDELLERIRTLGHPYVRLAGKKREHFSRIAITSGKGFIPEFFDQLVPEVYIAGEFEQEATKYAEDMGIMLVELSHHASESRPLEIVADTLQGRLKVPVIHIETPDTIECVEF